MYHHLPVRLVLAKMSDEIDKRMVGGVTGRALLDVVYRSDASGSSFDLLSEPNVNAMQLYRIRYNRCSEFAHACSEFATIAHNRLIVYFIEYFYSSSMPQ